MPSKRKKYNARFPAGRIKKIMQTDEEVGKVAQAVPVIISRTLELFVHSLLTKTMQVTNSKNAKTLSPSHMKQCILSESRFDFLKDLVKGLPDVSGADEDVPTPPLTPAPVSSMPGNMGCPPLLIKSEPDFQLEKNYNSSSCRVSKDFKGLGHSNSSQLTNMSSVPEFQMSTPASFGVPQPNFYTELKPMNLVGSPSKLSGTNQAIPNFSHTANIDEDYDT
ncbi:dr1-associated corepressor [Leptopilina heterotoma]|uniref:dr1-associated corepressor n=1 Tax=Leptopilina heterotoma TaxID=63436 RepID=UPI001CA8F3CE|nr:dr1-associated corepressor [Leptopilina heterotoma]